MIADPVRHLSRVDPVMRGLIRQIGPCLLKPRSRRAPFESLVRAIASQQLHEKAAERILARFIALFPGQRFPRPDQLLTLTATEIRAVGFSQAKAAALLDLAEKVRDGTVPGSRLVRTWDDEAIIERLTLVRGVGRWTAEMLLIFQLGRPDVLPADDFGVRNGLRIAYGLSALPTPKDVLRYGERWKPHRTAAAWYLWRAAERRRRPLHILKG